MVMAASTALPPFFKTVYPAAVARGWSETTAPFTPLTSGRFILGNCIPRSGRLVSSAGTVHPKIAIIAIGTTKRVRDLFRIGLFLLNHS
jgi:hypothetical protein